VKEGRARKPFPPLWRAGVGQVAYLLLARREGQEI